MARVQNYKETMNIRSLTYLVSGFSCEFSKEMKYTFNSSQFRRIFIMTLPLTSHLVLESFSNGKGATLAGSVAVPEFIVRKRSLKFSLRKSLLQNHRGISERRYPKLDGSLPAACSMQSASE